jgi:hypothetical protein
MESAESFTFPEIHRYWRDTTRYRVFSAALTLALPVYFLVSGHRSNEDGWILLACWAVAGIAALAHYARVNTMREEINQKFAIQFMFRTGYPPYPEDINVLEVKKIIAVRTDSGDVQLWRVKRKRDMFIISPA